VVRNVSNECLHFMRFFGRHPFLRKFIASIYTRRIVIGQLSEGMGSAE
jgi:hypothetical protein